MLVRILWVVMVSLSLTNCYLNGSHLQVYYLNQYCSLLINRPRMTFETHLNRLVYGYIPHLHGESHHPENHSSNVKQCKLKKHAGFSCLMHLAWDSCKPTEYFHWLESYTEMIHLRVVAKLNNNASISTQKKHICILNF